MSVRTALLMMNLGGPKTPADVEPFLVNMFSDRTFINIPFNLGPHIARYRARKSVRQQYEKIGGSPLSKWTEIQGEQITQILDSISPSTAPHKFYPCFRYCSPLSQEAIAQAQNDKAERIVAFTQYPHYSCATTGNSLRELLLTPNIRNLSAITKYATHPAYISAWTQLIKSQLQKFDNPNDVSIVFTAHSVPKIVVWRGDIYTIEIGSTVSSIMLSFNNPYYLFWQSKVGFQEWMQPSTGKALVSLGDKGVKNVLLVPIAFMQDHLETLYELDIEYVVEAQHKGMNVVRCPAPNDDPGFMKALALIVKEHLESGSHSLIPKCVNCPIPNHCKSLDILKKPY
jgi:protoporphyrin/coproporphyrin ferrochelatase